MIAAPLKRRRQEEIRVSVRQCPRLYDRGPIDGDDQPWLTPAAMGKGVAGFGGSDGAGTGGLRFSAGYGQMEQGGGPVVFLHLLRLVRRAVGRWRAGCVADCWNDQRKGRSRGLSAC